MGNAAFYSKLIFKYCNVEEQGFAYHNIDVLDETD